MMGHREAIKTGDEMDCFTSYTARNFRRSGRAGITKAKFNRRVRREVRVGLRRDIRSGDLD